MQPTMRAPSRSPPSYSKGSECGAALCALSKPDTFVQPTGRPTPMEHEMTNDDDYVYDEESGEWMSASELAARKAAAGQGEVRDAVGNILQAGDQVVLVKVLDVKGPGKPLQVGTVIKTIRLTDDPRTEERRVGKKCVSPCS